MGFSSIEPGHHPRGRCRSVKLDKNLFSACALGGLDNGANFVTCSCERLLLPEPEVRQFLANSEIFGLNNIDLVNERG